MQLAISIVLVLAGGIVAVAVAVARTGSVVALERFRLLVGVADVADRADGPDELVEGVLDLLVPVLGDVAAVDVILAGERLRIGARVAARGRSGGARGHGAAARAERRGAQQRGVDGRRRGAAGAPRRRAARGRGAVAARCRAARGPRASAPR